jgi:hypothetical protein
LLSDSVLPEPSGGEPGGSEPDWALGSLLQYLREQAERLSANVRGFPRPLRDRAGRRTPLPWVGGEAPLEGRWKEIDPVRAREAYEEGLCIVCGENLPDDYVQPLLHGEFSPYYPDDFDRFLRGGPPAPLQACPRCCLLAATFCPHLKQARFPARTQAGELLTHDQLKAYAHARATAS